MNIITLDYDPETNAQYHCDQWLNKMILESAQMLSTAHYIGGSWENFMYKPSHVHHPATKWVAGSVNAYLKTWIYFSRLLEEFRYRKQKQHACERLLTGLLGIPLNQPDDITFAEFPKIFRKGNEDLYEWNDTAEAYREYSRRTDAKWKDTWYPMKWTRRDVPEFMEQ